MKVDNPPSYVPNSKIPNNQNETVLYHANEIKVKETNSIKQDKETEKASKENLKNAVNSINRFIEGTKTTSLKFKLHDELEEYYVQVVDSTTEEVIREIPSKKLLDIYATMKGIVGIVVDKRI